MTLEAMRRDKNACWNLFDAGSVKEERNASLENAGPEKIICFRNRMTELCGIPVFLSAAADAEGIGHRFWRMAGTAPRV